MNAAQLDRRFGIDGTLSFHDTPQGLVRAAISSQAAEANIYLQGAHVAHWAPAGQRPVLFTSAKSLFAPGKAIRGGVPVIFPWFGPREGGKPGPSHGFARITPWSVESTEALADGSVALTLTLAPTEATRALGYGSFDLRARVVAGSSLKMELEARNDSVEPLHFEEALHTYLAIGDIARTSITGLEGAEFIDKTDGFQRKRQVAGEVRIARETDSVYVNTTATCIVNDAAWNRRIVVEKSGSETTVIWNPWVDKTAAMADMAPDEWRSMVCVETANTGGNGVTVAPGGRHRMSSTLRVEA